MRTDDEVRALWGDCDACPDFNVVVEELLNDRRTLLAEIEEMRGPLNLAYGVRKDGVEIINYFGENSATVGAGGSGNGGTMEIKK